MSSVRRRYVALATFLVVVLIAGVAAFVVTRSGDKVAEPPVELVVLGDSYASGEGNAPYEKGTDTAQDRCHRSLSDSFATIAAQRLGVRVMNLACSGAVIDGLFNAAGGEPSQVSRIPAMAKNIVVMVGGNDINALAYVFTQAVPQKLDSDLTALEPRLADSYKKVKEAAPSARVIAMGYPAITPAEASESCPISASQLDILNRGTASLNNTFADAAKKADVTFIDPIDAFRGHDLCSPTPWVNGLNPANPSASLHPNAVGQTRLAELVSAEIKK